MNSAVIGRFIAGNSIVFTCRGISVIRSVKGNCLHRDKSFFSCYTKYGRVKYPYQSKRPLIHLQVIYCRKPFVYLGLTNITDGSILSILQKRKDPSSTSRTFTGTPFVYLVLTNNRVLVRFYQSFKIESTSPQLSEHSQGLRLYIWS